MKDKIEKIILEDGHREVQATKRIMELIEKRELRDIEWDKAEEAHRTAEGYCCACGYDMAVMQDKIDEAYKRGKASKLNERKE